MDDDSVRLSQVPVNDSVLSSLPTHFSKKILFFHLNNNVFFPPDTVLSMIYLIMAPS